MYVDEEAAVFHRADCVGFEAGGDGSSGCGFDPAGRESDQVRELKQVVEENARLKRLVAELSLDKAVLQDVLSKKFPGQRS